MTHSNAALYFRCQRCDRIVWAREIVTECLPCLDAAKRAGLAPIQGGVAGE